jgi:hypothetical protein
MRREFLDFVIPFSERHLRSLLKEWVAHYNQARPHSSLGPGVPEPSDLMPLQSDGRHTLPRGSRVMARPVLGGLHHEYRLEKVAARPMVNRRRTLITSPLDWFLNANPVPLLLYLFWLSVEVHS